MESMDYWRLCDELSIIQAALLIVGEDPSGANNYVEGWEPQNQPVGYQAAKAALINAVNSNELAATPRRDILKSHIENAEPTQLITRSSKIGYALDIELTTIKVKDLRVWLSKRGFKTGFFFPDVGTDRPDYLDSQHPNYSPKLAAAIEAWLAVTETPELTKAKSVKQTIMIWLRSHAGRFGLIKDDGNPNETGIEEVAKVVNWKTSGGAPEQ